MACVTWDAVVLRNYEKKEEEKNTKEIRRRPGDFSRRQAKRRAGKELVSQV